MEAQIVTRSLQGTSELTLFGRIKPHLIDSLETRTYETRLRAVLQTLHTLRQTSREYSMVRTFSDSTDRIRTITDLRMAILPEEKKLLLAVTFDRPWEPYLRIIWREVGTLLDVIFCNCDGYPISYKSDFATYGKWIRDARTDSKFLYNPASITFDDGQYLRRAERMAVERPITDLDLARLTAPDPARVAMETAAANAGYTVKQGMQALSVIYRLADVYPPNSADGDILLRAARELLRELMPVLSRLPKALQAGVYARFKAQLEWFNGPFFEAEPKPPPFTEPADTKDVQRGILTPHDVVTHGCVLLYSFPDPKSAADFLQSIGRTLCLEGEPLSEVEAARKTFVNVAFTPDGLRALGLTADEMKLFPHDFLQGMQERAGLLGDVRGNHPRNWTLPALNWPTGGVMPPENAQVNLATVHAVVQMATKSSDNGHQLEASLKARIEKLAAEHPGVRLLSVQPTRRYLEDTLGKTREHFGFIDGLSQPVIGKVSTADKAWTNEIGKGELLLGYGNDRGDAPDGNPWGVNGSFLVIRKLRQDVAAFNAVLGASGLPPEEVKAAMMGRKPDGEPLARPGSVNEFHYDGDPSGGLCPFAAHIRRANPRTEQLKDPHGQYRPTVPRIMRRGMSYGPKYSAATAAEERGIVFMAYNASLSEQFEVIQRWLTGGNSTNVLSEHRDPFLGVPQAGETRAFRFHDGKSVSRVKLDDASGKAPPMVRVEWGLYAFAPSATVLKKLEERARTYKPAFYARPVNMPEVEVAKIEKTIDDLIAKDREFPNPTPEQKEELIAGWKAVLEDSQARAYGQSEAIWAALRRRGGVLRTSYGVIVSKKKELLEVLSSRANASVCGYVGRLTRASGMMYLGRDETEPEYKKESVPVNTAIFAVPEEDAFARARYYASAWLEGLKANTIALATGAGEPRWELTFDLKEVSDFTLAKLCEEWFGMRDDGKHFRAGGSPWNWKPTEPPYYPGHFTAPSRYVFQPNPQKSAISTGEERGDAIKRAMIGFIKECRDTGNLPSGRIVEPILAAFPTRAEDELLARTILGTLIGFLPTTEGNFRATMNEWLDERVFWDLQTKFGPPFKPADSALAYAKAKTVLRDPLVRTMMFRPAPEVSWRTAKVDHVLGGEKIKAGEKISISLVSATHEDLAAGKADVSTVFGGARKGGAVQPPDLPTHACPGYKIGMGVLLGMITALIEVGPLRPTPAPLTVSLAGKVP